MRYIGGFWNKWKAKGEREKWNDVDSAMKQVPNEWKDRYFEKRLMDTDFFGSITIGDRVVPLKMHFNRYRDSYKKPMFVVSLDEGRLNARE